MNSHDRQSPALLWQQGQIVELDITDVSNGGDGVGRFEGRAVFVPSTVTGDRIRARLVRVKPQYAHGKLIELLKSSSHRIRPRCIVADKCGGCQWQHINDEYQRVAKRRYILEILKRIGGFAEPTVAPPLHRDVLNYRNKATYPLNLSSTGQVQAGYYRRGSHRLVNLNQCPVQDTRFDPLLAQVKRDIERRGWSIYNEQTHQGQLRHFSLRIGRRTGEMLLTLISTDWHLPELEHQAQQWMQRYPQLVGVALNYNPQRTNVIVGKQTRAIAGQLELREIFADLEFRLRPETFFQINTETAEALLEVIVEQLDLQGEETVLDAYCGIGTFALPLARRVQQVIGIEVQAAAVQQAHINAQLNNIANVSFQTGAVEDLLPQLEVSPDIVLLDPPRQGCNHQTLDALLKSKPPRLVYVSCNPATLARDLKLLCQNSSYSLIFVQPADFFPQTAHAECAAFLGSAEIL
ncbi:MAG: 23S rRNA (uracil(1939)-C(5))-methyltransferase RlmD [Cyanophyceae cyanobacterium]